MDTPQPPAAARLPAFVFWMVWTGFLVGIFLIFHFLSRDVRPGDLAREPAPWVIGAVPVFISAILRWIVLPRVADATKALPIFVFGLATAEVATFLGLFIFPSHARDLFILSVFGIAQWIPFFVRRFSDPLPRHESLRG